MVHTFQSLKPGLHPPFAALAAAHAADAVNLLSWVPYEGPGPILSGERDAHIRSYAQAIGTLDFPVLLRFAHEMNLRGTSSFGEPEPFIAAWRRVRNLFDEVGSANATWIWCPYVLDRNTRSFEPYYPGHDVVDVVGLDGYNWGRQRWWHRWWRGWRSFDDVFGASYAALRRLAPDKPIILAELGCAEPGGDKAAWMRDALLRAVPQRFPGIEAVVWFDHHRPDHPDWRTDSSPAALAAWREIAADPRYQLTGAELLDRLSRTPS